MRDSKKSKNRGFKEEGKVIELWQKGGPRTLIPSSKLNGRSRK